MSASIIPYQRASPASLEIEAGVSPQEPKTCERGDYPAKCGLGLRLRPPGAEAPPGDAGRRDAPKHQKRRRHEQGELGAPARGRPPRHSGIGRNPSSRSEPFRAGRVPAAESAGKQAPSRAKPVREDREDAGGPESRVQTSRPDKNPPRGRTFQGKRLVPGRPDGPPRSRQPGPKPRKGKRRSPMRASQMGKDAQARNWVAERRNAIVSRWLGRLPNSRARSRKNSSGEPGRPPSGRPVPRRRSAERIRWRGAEAPNSSATIRKAGPPGKDRRDPGDRPNALRPKRRLSLQVLGHDDTLMPCRPTPAMQNACRRCCLSGLRASGFALTGADTFFRSRRSFPCPALGLRPFGAVRLRWGGSDLVLYGAEQALFTDAGMGSPVRVSRLVSAGAGPAFRTEQMVDVR